MLNEDKFNRILEYGIRLHKDESLRFSYEKYIEAYDGIISNANSMIINSNTNNELVEYCYLYAMQWAYLAAGIIDPDDKSSQPNFPIQNAFYCIFATIANYILSITQLALGGMDLQASALLRNFYELIMLFIAISVDSELFNRYLQCSDVNDATSVWYKNFRINTISKIVSTYEKKHGFSANDILIESQEKLYKRLSSFVHHQSTAIFIYNYGKTSDPEDQMVPNILGYPMTRTNDIIDLMCSILEYANFMFHLILEENRNHLAHSIEIKYQCPVTTFETTFNYFVILADGFHLDMLFNPKDNGIT